MAQEQPLLFSKRLNLALLCFLGCAIAYALRSNLSFAIVCMVRETGEEGESSVSKSKGQCGGVNKSDSDGNGNAAVIDVSSMAKQTDGQGPAEIMPQTLGEFEWSKQVRGQVLGAFFFGYLTSQMLGGILAARVGPKIVILSSLLVSSVLSLLSPEAARLNVAFFVLLRALLGFAQGVMFPAMHCLWSNWAPPLERSLLTGVSYAGAQIGNVVVMPLSGILCEYAWSSIFYSLSIAGLCWCLLWSLTAADSPRTHSSIKSEEREFIMESLGQHKEGKSSPRRPIPLGAILQSRAVWAVFIGHFAGDWGAYTMALGLPSFLNDVLGMDLTSMGFASALPYIAYFAVINIGGHLSDSLQKRKILSTLNTRRLAMMVALLGQAAFLLLIALLPCGHDKLVIALLCISIGISGLQYSGFVVNYLDICPQFAGFVLGIGNTIACVPGLVSPILMGWLTPNGSKGEWLAVFGITAVVLCAGAVLFSLMASAEIQSWAREEALDCGSEEQQQGDKKTEPVGEKREEKPLLEEDNKDAK